MTTKERALQAIRSLPDDATLHEIVDRVRALSPSEPDLSPPAVSLPDLPLPEGSVWDLLEHVAGTVVMPADWAARHDHGPRDTPERPRDA